MELPRFTWFLLSAVTTASEARRLSVCSGILSEVLAGGARAKEDGGASYRGCPHQAPG